MKIKVLVVDDSSVIRNILTAIIDEQPDMTVVGAAPDPLAARDLIGKLNPDVLTLDIEMPRMNGLSFLKRLMAVRPMPVVMLPSFTQLGSDVAFQALQLGAVDFVGRPAIGGPVDAGYAERVVGAIRGAFAARKNLKRPDNKPRDAARLLPNLQRSEAALQLLAVIGASTGGMEAIREIVTALPDDAPPLVVALQVPAAGISRLFVKKLGSESRVAVREAADGEPVLPGHAYFAPGDSCMTVARYGKRGFGINLHPLAARPVDRLFKSAAAAAGASAMGVILTGMGDDGAAGLRAMYEKGAHTIAQDKETSLVYGMPKAALENEAVILEVPLPKIAKAILDWASWGEVQE